MKELTFNEYQNGALETAQYPEVETINDFGGLTGTNFVYPVIGLVGEAGEVAEKCKKIIRDKKGLVEETDKQAIKKELGDVLWYVAVLAKEFDLNLDEVAKANYEKLKSRKERNVISGNGDDR